MDVSAWHNPYDTLIGERIPDSEREFINEEYYRNLSPQYSQGKRFIPWYTEGATNSLERAKAKEITRKGKAQRYEPDQWQDQRLTQAVKVKEKETRRRKRMQAMSFQANEYGPIIE